ncbi:acyl-CoA dehydrogenase family protein [Henriciella litoralis]|uniref:flavin-dependent monooxygenase n=1 Tax=Henriciella litoralis TaxID=568102 RepID=UPI00111BEC60|nr:flavin-dependent monooxygenase [Henriciella litoralis]
MNTISLAATSKSGKSADSIPTAEELVARARAMIPTLKSRAKQCTSGRDVPVETIDEMRQAGFFRILQPKRWGGYEMHPNVFYDVQKALAEGCMSTGWMFGVLGCHPFELALMDSQAQEDVWGENNETLISSSYQPVGKVEHAEGGGYYLSGHWGFSTGSVHCKWVFLGAVAPPKTKDGNPEMMIFLVPRSDYEIQRDAWHVFGLQGTGSHDIVVDRAFVPEHRVHRPSEAAFSGIERGHKENDAPLYRIPWAQIFIRSVNTAALGGAQAAIKGAMNIMENRISTNTNKASKDDPMLHAAIAAAKGQCAEMDLMLRHQFEDLIGYAESGEPVPMTKRALYAYHACSVVRRVAKLVDDMAQLLGGRAIYTHSEIIQPWLDLHAARAHVMNDPNLRTKDVINTELGLFPEFPFM